MTKTQKQLEKGCGKSIHEDINGDFKCGNMFKGEIVLCPSCKSLLSQKIEDKKRVMEIIDSFMHKKLQKANKKGKYHIELCYDSWQELKNSVEKI